MLRSREGRGRVVSFGPGDDLEALRSHRLVQLALDLVVIRRPQAPERRRRARGAVLGDQLASVHREHLIHMLVGLPARVGLLNHDPGLSHASPPSCFSVLWIQTLSQATAELARLPVPRALTCPHPLARSSNKTRTAGSGPPTSTPRASGVSASPEPPTPPRAHSAHWCGFRSRHPAGSVTDRHVAALQRAWTAARAAVFGTWPRPPRSGRSPARRSWPG